MQQIAQEPSGITQDYALHKEEFSSETVVETTEDITLEPSDSRAPRVFDLWHGDKHDYRHFTDTVVNFAEAGGAFVYPIVTERGTFVVSPRSLEIPESQEAYKKDQIEQVKSLIEDGLTPDDIMAGFLTCRGDTFYYSLTLEEIKNLAKELGQARDGKEQI